MRKNKQNGAHARERERAEIRRNEGRQTHEEGNQTRSRREILYTDANAFSGKILGRDRDAGSLPRASFARALDIALIRAADILNVRAYRERAQDQVRLDLVRMQRSNSGACRFIDLKIRPHDSRLRFPVTVHESKNCGSRAGSERVPLHITRYIRGYIRR